MEPGPSAPGERSLAGWEQQAGFSVFFDLAHDQSGDEIWQVRLYHEESAEEAVVVGRDVDQYARWITNRVSSARMPPTNAVPAPTAGSAKADDRRLREELVVEVVSVQLVDRRPGAGGTEEEARVDAVVRLTGLSNLLRSIGGAIMNAALDQQARDE